MTREEAIKIIDCYDINFYDLSGEKIPANKLAEAFDMAIEALSEVRCNDCKWNDDVIEVVRCKDCRFRDTNYGHADNYDECRWIQDERPDDDDYCSFGERAEQTKYPATYNIDTRCGGCVHLDELGRCLSFMTAKDDRSCWQGSWENNMGCERREDE